MEAKKDGAMGMDRGTNRRGKAPLRRAALALTGALALAAPAASEDGGSDLKVSGYAWTDYQYVPEVYKGAANFDNNFFTATGGVLFLHSQPSERWAADLSLGVAFGNSAIKRNVRDTNNTIIGRINPNSLSLGMGGFLHEAALSYNGEAFSWRVGRFHYKYSDYNHNLGLYLLRGPVYPGFLYSGFEDIHALTKTGMLFSFSPSESFRFDLLPSLETNYKPYMDFNLSGFATFRAGILELGAGVESQRLLEFNPCVTSPKNGTEVNECLGGEPKATTIAPGADLYQSAFYLIDTAGVGAGGQPDTLTYSLAGTKVMFRGALDFKKALAGYSGSSKDFVLYWEAALLGIKDYKYLYEKKGERLPVLVGMNFPTFGALDLLSLEVQYYNAPYQNDPYKLVGAYDVFQFADGNSINYAMSPIPPSNKAGEGHLSKAQQDFDPKQDNLKWSLYVAKRLFNRITFKGQIASDHWRVPNNNYVQYEVLSKPSLYYLATRIDYSL